ncbi:C-Maf-inducing protein [Nymphon striatum]|nr:C-Maf-inducing protein [Nymphon striatum]
MADFTPYASNPAMNATGFMEDPLAYSSIENILGDGRWDSSQTHQKYVIRIYTSEGSLHLQTTTPYLRDRWLHSIQWKRNVHKYRKTLLNTRRPEVLTKELKSMVEFSSKTPLQDSDIKQTPLEIASEIIRKTDDWLSKETSEEIIHILTPLLEMSHPSPEICELFSKHCRDSPRSCLIMDLFSPVIRRILKHNLDFCKHPKMRIFIQDFINALNAQNDRYEVMRSFVSRQVFAHGPASCCPHPRILPNLMSIGLAAVHSLFEEKQTHSEEMNNTSSALWEWEQRLECIVIMFEKMISYDDWRPALAQLLQPIPFPDRKMKSLIRRLGTDPQCDVHLMVLGVRDKKEGWFHLYCLGGIACDDDGQLFTDMLKKLMDCCCKTKRFLEPMAKLLLGPCTLLALRDSEVAQRVLCAMLELNVIENEDYKLQIITTLQSTVSSKIMYAALCDRQNHVRQLQQKGGPRKLTLPSRSTDSDLAKLLSSGSFGNLECLSLAFTNVTSACAEHLIKLPSLRYLNFWSTQLGDSGLQLICDHLPKLQVLNLCEAPVSDKSIASLGSLKNLRKLNLNSTKLTASTFETLKIKLPSLQQCDIRYTDAWEVSDSFTRLNL